MNYSLDEAAAHIEKKLNKKISPRKIRELAINGKIALCFLYRGTAHNCAKQIEEDIYGYPIILPGYIAELEMRGSYPASFFFYNNSLYKILPPNFAVTLTNENLLIHESYVEKIIKIYSIGEVTSEPKREKTQIMQERLIIEAIEHLGFDRYKLLPNQPGKAGIPKMVKDFVSEAHKLSFIGTTVFDKAWDRLLSKREIAYIK